MPYITSIAHSFGTIFGAIISLIPQSLGPVFLLAMAITIVNAFLLALFALVGWVFLVRMKVSSEDLEEQRKQGHYNEEALLDHARKEARSLVEQTNKDAVKILQDTQVYAQEQRKQAHHNAEELLDHARKEAIAMTEETNKKVRELFEQAQAVTKTVHTDLTESLRAFSQKENERVGKVAEDLVATYRGMIDSIRQQYGAAIGTTAKEMADLAQHSLKEFQELLKDQTTRYEGILKQQTQEGFVSAQKEISNYKRESLQKVEEAIYRILNLVSKSIIGKALSLDDQQDLVFRALDEAKQEGFFES